MINDNSTIKQTIREFVLTELLKNKNVSKLADDTPLITGGLVDSISTMQLIVFLEKTFQVEYEAHEVDRDNFDSINSIANFLIKKIK